MPEGLSDWQSFRAELGTEGTDIAFDVIEVMEWLEQEVAQARGMEVVLPKYDETLQIIARMKHAMVSVAKIQSVLRDDEGLDSLSQAIGLTVEEIEEAVYMHTNLNTTDFGPNATIDFLLMKSPVAQPLIFQIIQSNGIIAELLHTSHAGGPYEAEEAA